MGLEQKMERSEELLETNERNKQQVEHAKRAVQQAQSQVLISQARVNSYQAQLNQAIAARNAVRQQASNDDEGTYSLASYDAAVSDAQSALSEANMELQSAQRERIRADEALGIAETAHRESSGQLSAVSQELHDISRKYGLELSKTQALMNTAEGRLASPLFERLGIGRDRVDDLRRRIAASLGIAFAVDRVSGTGGFHGVASRRAGLAPGGATGTGGQITGSAVSTGMGVGGTATPGGTGGKLGGVFSPGGTGFQGSNGIGGTAASVMKIAPDEAGTAAAATGSSVGYQSPYVKTTYEAPVRYTDPQTGMRMTKVSKRTVYQNQNMDPHQVIPAGTRFGTSSALKRDMTNLEIMREGHAPYVCRQNSDGSVSYVQLELHHLTGEETLSSSTYFQGESLDGTLVETPVDIHDKYSKQLHNINENTSFRTEKQKIGDERVRVKTADNNKYNNFRSDYWQNRAATIDAESGDG